MSSYVKNEHICGRPLGLRFDKRTGEFYIADAYFGLMKVGPQGGLATSLVTEAEGVPLRFTNDLDIDDEGNVYFTDSSTKYQRRYALVVVLFFCSSFPSAFSMNGSFVEPQKHIKFTAHILHLMISSCYIYLTLHIDLGTHLYI